MKKELKLCLSSVLLFLCGFTLVCLYGSWPLAVGLFLAMWGNNISERLNKVNKNG